MIPSADHPPYHRSVETHLRLDQILANAITHGVGAILALAGGVYLIVAAAHAMAPADGAPHWGLVASCAVFSTTLVLVYVCSTLYHSLVRTRARHVFQVLDHAAIYLLIAGTYTPFTLIALRGPLGWALFGFVWTLAVAGVVFKSFAVGRFQVASALVYLLQGWCGVFATGLLARAIGWNAVWWLLAGGLAYTVGVAFFALDRLRYFHATWHVFVLAGSAAHYVAVLVYLLPARV